MKTGIEPRYAGARSIPRKLSVILRWSVSHLALIVFYVSAPIVLIAYAIGQVFFSPATYLDAFDQLELGQTGGGIIAEAAAKLSSNYARKGFDPRSLARIHSRTWKTFAHEIVPPDWLRKTYRQAILVFFEWLRSDAPVPEIVVDLAPIGDSLRGPGGTLAILPLLQGLPACEGESITIQAGLVVSCVNPDSDLTPLANFVADNFADSLPRKLSLAEMAEADLLPRFVLVSLAEVRSRHLWLELAVRGGLYTYGALLSLYLLLETDSFKQTFRRLWPPLLVTGIIVLLGAGLTHLALRWLWLPAIPVVLGFLWGDYQILIGDLSLYLSREIVARLARLGGTLLASGGLSALLWQVLEHVHLPLPAQAVPIRHGIRKQFF